MAQTYTVNVTRRQRVPLDGGFTTQLLPGTKEQVRVEVDFESLARMYGEKAALSKGGKSVVAHGAVVIRHIR
ncbi:MAG: hypothetical protein NUV74_05595 [Candidatus Brocadiaceae bacterium]|nr:hypothetical protein [Candidatus Brocadiaceae bacterium]